MNCATKHFDGSLVLCEYDGFSVNQGRAMEVVTESLLQTI